MGLLGNVIQWTLDWYTPDWYKDPAATGADVANLTMPNPIQRSLRGGFWATDINYLRSAFRHSGWISRPNSRGVGFRCARDL
jgi:formylglycine-generating enzyme required for sulfatase activity